MRIHLVGEAGDHVDDLVPHLTGNPEVVTLPAGAAHDASYDDHLGPDDVLVSLRLDRGAGAAPPVGLLHVPGAGLDGVKLGALSEHTSVCNVFEHEAPIAEFTMTCLLEWEIRPEQMRRQMTAGPWSEVYRHRVPHGEVMGHRLLLVGYGRIGRAIAARATAFGIEVHALDDQATPDDSAELHPTDALMTELPLADYVVLACPLTESTRGLLGPAQLAAMRSDALLVNPSRAPLIDEAALYDALAAERIGGAFLDVWYRYPGPDGEPDDFASHPFHQLSNAWCSPHSSAWTRELPTRRYALVADNINRFFDGRPLRNVVQGPRTHPRG